MGQSSREINKAHWQPNAASAQSGTPIVATAAKAIVPGSSGSTWRMSKLQRTHEQATEEARPLLEVALEKYGTEQAWEEALEERRVLDARKPQSRNDRAGPSGSSRKFIYNDSTSTTPLGSRPASRNELFRKPGESTVGTSTPTSKSSTPAPGGHHTPIPNVFTPNLSRAPSTLSTSILPLSIVPNLSSSEAPASIEAPLLDQSALNKLQAAVLKARLMDLPNADQLESEYDTARARFLSGGSASFSNSSGTDIRVLPTLDGQGRLYDVGQGLEIASEQPQNKVSSSGRIRKPKEKAFQSHDPKTGELIAINANDNTTSLAELVRQEKFSGGGGGMDADLAQGIMKDTRYVNSLDYTDENAEGMARQKMRSEVLKKAFAINGA